MSKLAYPPMCTSSATINSYPNGGGLLAVWPDRAIFCTLGTFLKPLATNNLPKSLTFLGNFVKVSKSIIFLVTSFLGSFYRHLAIFFLVTLAACKAVQRSAVGRFSCLCTTPLAIWCLAISKKWFRLSCATEIESRQKLQLPHGHHHGRHRHEETDLHHVGRDEIVFAEKCEK